VIVDAIAWVCRSPRRLVVSAAVLIAALLVGGSALFSSGGSPGDGRAAAAPAATTPAAQVPDAGPFVDAAVAFVRLWSQMKPGESRAQWQAAVTPLATPLLGTELKTVDPANLPGAGPTGEPVVRVVSQSSSLIAVPLANGSSVLVTVVQSGQKVLVSDIQPNVGD
jgi:hypothetical protein